MVEIACGVEHASGVTFGLLELGSCSSFLFLFLLPNGLQM